MQFYTYGWSLSTNTRSTNVCPNMFVHYASHGTSSIVVLLKLLFDNGWHTWHPPSSSFFLNSFLKLITKNLFCMLLCALWYFCKLQKNWKFAIVEFFPAFSLAWCNLYYLHVHLKMDFFCVKECCIQKIWI